MHYTLEGIVIPINGDFQILFLCLQVIEDCLKLFKCCVVLEMVSSPTYHLNVAFYVSKARIDSVHLDHLVLPAGIEPTIYRLPSDCITILLW